MEAYLRKYLWLATPLVILLCALFAAKAVGHLVIAQIPAPKASRVLQRPRSLMGVAIKRGRDLSEVVSRNVFCAKCEPIALASAQPDETQANAGGVVDDGEPVKSSLELRLLATVVSDEDKAWSYATLLSSVDQKVGMYAIGSKIADSATVTDIESRRILLENGGRAEFIELDGGGENESAGEPVRSVEPQPRARRTDELTQLNDEVRAGVRSLGPNSWEIQRSALNKVLTNTTLLARSARIVPSLKDGKPNGFKLYAIRPGSIYSLIGLQNGDTINAINGNEMTTPDKALEVYTKLRNASHLSISFSRRGQTKTHDYNIR